MGPSLSSPGKEDGLAEGTLGAGARAPLGLAMEGLPSAPHLPRGVWGAPRVVSW